MASGRVIGRGVRDLEVGFALQFLQLQEVGDLEYLIKPAADLA